ncbi:redoxin family protein [Deinococcus deserti]|uniref:redoxin family protein n=1 Tax=Deinococcus deserti TaxID=310783 RepID=UPI00192B51DD|nr:redoxin family protein [Deinococcus deserti]
MYPRMARPGVPMPDDRDLILGAWGCSPQSLCLPGHHAELQAAGARGFGLSVQNTAEQQEAAARLHLPFPLHSDTERLSPPNFRLPTFEAGGSTLLRRVTLILRGGTVEYVFSPVFPRTAMQQRC